MTIALVVHGHFYQPPRENPWTGLIDREPGAEPFHDWNERIHAECYRPNAHARIVDEHGRVVRIVNNYANLSFNFGPTLLAWLERQHPETYARIIGADRESARLRGGHGNAIAQGYHHAILPLCNERDRRTQVRWGVGDFRLRFGREPESLWLPETACDAPTLETLIEEGLRFVILSPHQAARVRPLGAGDWLAVPGGSVNTSVPYKFFHRDGSGRSIAIFFYDGPTARAIAFEGLLASSHELAGAFASRAARSGGPLVSVATDGESYGHHFRWGDRCIAYTLQEEARRRGFLVTNYGEFLDRHEPQFEVELAAGPSGEGTAWSCAHGLGRWSRDCGCHSGAPAGWDQRWRAPLRAALDLLRDDFAAKFESVGGDLFRDAWAARDDYVEVLSGREGAREAFLARHARRALPDGERVIAFTLLEAARAALAMYASCGWFFDDIAGLETLIVLRQAGRAIELMEELSLAPPVASFLDALSEARSNVLEKGNGADIFLRTLAQTRATARSVTTGKSNGSAVKLDEDDYKRALELAREAARLGRRFDRASAGRALEGALTSAARAAAVRPTPENLRSVRELIELGRELGLEANAERAQEFIYEAVTSGAPPPDGLREVALALNISPAAFAPAGEADDAVPAFTGGQGG